MCACMYAYLCREREKEKKNMFDTFELILPTVTRNVQPALALFSEL